MSVAALSQFRRLWQKGMSKKAIMHTMQLSPEDCEYLMAAFHGAEMLKPIPERVHLEIEEPGVLSQRPKAEYTNSSPYGIAAELHNTKSL